MNMKKLHSTGLVCEIFSQCNLLVIDRIALCSERIIVIGNFFFDVVIAVVIL